jgi:hypothetical protein
VHIGARRLFGSPWPLAGKNVALTLNLLRFGALNPRPAGQKQTHPCPVKSETRGFRVQTRPTAIHNGPVGFGSKPARLPFIMESHFIVLYCEKWLSSRL